jgi:hypothetical protein
MEFSIKHFSQLYQQITGQTLTPTSNFKIGAFGNSGEDGGISEAYFPEQNVNLGQATVPPEVCPANPPILINPHQGRHVNTAHQTNVRVNIFSTSGFDATQIDPSTVRLGGASPIGNFTRRIVGYPFPEETFVFNGLDINLPPGITTATVTGNTYTGTPFSSSVTIFNRNDSYYSAKAIQSRDTRIGRMSATELNAMAADVAATNASSVGGLSLASLTSTGSQAATPAAAASNQTAATSATPAVTVSIPKKNVVHPAHVAKVKVRVRTAVANSAARGAANAIASGAA